MMLMDKKKMASTILSSLPKPEVKEVAMDKPEKQASEGLMSAAEDILAAIKSGNAKALSSALKSHAELLEYEKDEEPAVEEIGPMAES
jgi:DNA-binding GntR family transcriptional regulator